MSTPIKLYLFPSPDSFNYSPFGAKVEVYMKMAKIPHTVVREFDPGKGPKDKIPFIVDGDRTIGDSNFIIEYLQEKFPNSLNEGLTPEQHARGHALQRMLEEHLYFTILYCRWADDAVWPTFRELSFAGLPAPLKWFIPGMVRKKILKSLQYQGVGRHTLAEVYHLAALDIASLVTALGQGPFLFGDKWTTYDASLYGFVKNLIGTSFRDPLKEIAEKHGALAAYCQRFEAELTQQ